MDSFLISIIIPTYNRGHLIKETLDSIIAQTYTNWECIVVDDGSTDNTEELLAVYCEKDNRIQYHHRPKDRPKGANSCRNYGFELSKGEYVNWFDSDDVLLKDFIKTKVDSINNTLDLIICSGYEVDSLLKNKKEIVLNEDVNLFKEYVMWRLPVLTPSVLFKKSFLFDKELFSNKISRGQETELFSRLFFNLDTANYIIINEPLFLYRQHLDTKTSKNKTYNKGYKESQSYINFENFKRSLQINDEELISHLYKALIKLLFLGIKNNHIENSKIITKNLISVLKEKNKKLITELFIFTSISFLIKKSSYKIEKYFENYQIQL